MSSAAPPAAKQDFDQDACCIPSALPFQASESTRNESLIENDQFCKIRGIVEDDSVFKSFLPGISIRWYRKFRNPSFCPMMLCGSSCADISGKPRIGAYDLMQLLSDRTPCSLEDTELNGGCCFNSTMKDSYGRSFSE